jgi:hypothetical protein
VNDELKDTARTAGGVGSSATAMAKRLSARAGMHALVAAFL